MSQTIVRLPAHRARSIAVIAASPMFLALLVAPAWASEFRVAQSSGSPGVITEGASGVSVGGAPAARAGDRTSEGSPVANGSSNVFINGRPAVTIGDNTACGGIVVGGASGVFINGKPVARAGDTTTGCPGK